MDTKELVQQFKEHHADIKSALEKAGVKDTELDARLFELEQKMARSGGDYGEPARGVGLGALVTKSNEYDTFIANGMTGKQRIAVKTLITSDGASAGTLIPPDRQTDVSLMPRRQMRVRDLLDARRTTSNSIEFLRQLSRTNNAATVAEGALKPESALTFEEATAAVRTIAHWVPVTKQAFADAPQLAAIIEGELMYGLKYVEDNQLLNGGGTGQDLQGIYTIATAFSAPITLPTPVTKADVLRLALLQASLAGYPATGIVMHPTDWATIQLVKDTTGRYVLGNTPMITPGQTLWNLPVVDTQAMAIDKFLVGAFGLASQIFDREDAHILIADQHEDFFVKNKLVVLCEERLALVNRRPAAMVKGDFSDAITASTTT